MTRIKTPQARLALAMLIVVSATSATTLALAGTSGTVCATPNLAIPDGDANGIDTTITLSGGTIDSINVRLVGSHTWVGDLIFRLTHPDGLTSVDLINRPGVPASTFGCQEDNFDVWLDDSGPDGPVENQCSSTPPALFGRATPNQPLTGFSGLDADGSWTLTVIDSVSPDPGTLTQWCLDVTLSGDFTVTAMVGSGQGSISPASQTINGGGNAEFFVIAAPGWSVGSINGDTCTPADNGDGTWTAANINADCEVIANFIDDGGGETFTVTAVVEEGNGSITPSSQMVEVGDSAQFNVVPAANWRIKEVRGDTCSPEPAGGDSYIANNISADCIVSARFELITWTVTPTTFGGGGSISPNLPQIVPDGDPIVFTLNPSANFVVDEVSGSCGGTLKGTNYTTDPVTADCDVIATFRFVTTFTVTPGVTGIGGSISPDTPQSVEENASAVFEILPNPGFSIDAVTGSCGGNLVDTSYTTNPITADCNVEASFTDQGDEVFMDQFEVKPFARPNP